MTSPVPTRQPDRQLLALSELALVAVHLTVVAGFTRVYADGSFFWPLVTLVLVAQVLAASLRRRHVSAPLTMTVAMGSFVLLASLLLFGSTTRFGLPTADTVRAARDALQLARSEFSRVFAPVPVMPGFQLAAGFALTAAVWFADWAAFRLRATVEALLPGALVFLFCAQLGSGRFQIASAAAFSATALCFVLVHRAMRIGAEQPWLAARRANRSGPVLRLGLVVVVLAVTIGALAGPRLPGSDAEAVIDWRARGGEGGNRSTVSPIVDLQKRLVNQSDDILFVVEADRPAYWRLTSLDQFNGQIWSSDGTYGEAEGSLDSERPQAEDAPRAPRNVQQFSIRSLSAIWAPAAFEPRRLLSASAGLRWDGTSSTLITDQADDSDQMAYEVVSETPLVDPIDLDRVLPNTADDIGDEFVGLPADFPAVATDTAQEVTSGASTRYEQALALQEFFRNQFTYSLEVDPGHGDEALVRFLDSRSGYCEQFAGAYAAMARSIGMPARVAVGFTPGDEDPNEPGRYIVRGRHAHAWPEVYFTGVGWVPFEPTPGRGNPDGSAYTGVESEQAGPDAASPASPDATTTTAVAATPSSVPATSTTTIPVPPTDLDVGGGAGPSTGQRALQVALGVVALAILWALTLAVGPTLVRRLRGDVPTSPVLEAWHRAVVAAGGITHLRPLPTETYQEFATRTGDVDPALGRPLDDLAGLAAAAAWAPVISHPDRVTHAERLADVVGQVARDRQSGWDRIRGRFSWRKAFDRQAGGRRT